MSLLGHADGPAEKGAAPPDAPSFHVAPRQGWLNDPNGLIFYRGRYHMCAAGLSFYQHVETGCEWTWGLVWGHAVSEDLVHWRRLPPALRPTPDGPDADGCWSGCCGVSAEGVPSLLYTGVRLRSAPSGLPSPPPERDQGLPFIESQCVAVPADPDDELLIVWRKLPQPLALALPPRGLGLTGWRDPFVYWGGRSAADAPGSSTSAAAAAAAAGDGATSRQQASPAGYRMLLGSGFKGGGGALLGYSSDGGTNSCGATTLAEGWQYTGPVCSVADLAAAQAELAGGAAALGPAASADMSPAAAAHELGEVWECPLLAQLPAAEGAAAAAAGGEDRGAEPPAWLLAVSPYPVKPPHSPSNPVLYWVGGMDGALSRFELAQASGPFRLDRGDVLYAPNVCTNGQGRLLLWAWLQERRPPGTAAAYSGCLTVPRLLRRSPDGRRLVQQPAPEVARLRRGNGGVSSSSQGNWHAEGVEVAAEQALAVEGVSGGHLDLELCFSRGTAAAAGLLLESHEAGSQGNALITYCWQTNALEVTFGVAAPQAQAVASSACSSPAAAPLPHLPAAPSASSPRKKGAAAAAAALEASPPGSPTAVQAQLAALAEPLPEAAAVEEAAKAEAAAAATPARRLGGPLTAPAADEQGRVQLRVLIDGSALEVFTGSGEVLSTRVYRGRPPAGAGAGVSVVALGGAAVLERGDAWEMGSCWREEGT